MPFSPWMKARMAVVSRAGRKSAEAAAISSPESGDGASRIGDEHPARGLQGHPSTGWKQRQSAALR